MTDAIEQNRLEEAADWADRLDSLTAAERTELGAWLHRAPHNRAALARMVRLLGDPALFEVIETAGHVHVPVAPRARTRRWRRTDRPMPRHGVAAALAATLVAAVVAPVAWQRLNPGNVVVARTYDTGVAQQRQLTLPDASTMRLDAATQVAIAFSPTARDLSLVRGAARFEVRHDAARPFAVSTPEGQMIALGTDFSVDRGAGHSELRVFRGRVRLSVPGQPAVVVTAGHWAEAGAGRIALHRFDPADHQDWQDRWLTGERIRLGDAVARIGRYSERPVRLADPRLADRTFSGRFRLDRPAESLRLIGALFDLPVDDDGRRIVLGRRAD
jgi:transmembrane sensor